jgi:predicted nucleotidyltransferase
MLNQDFKEFIQLLNDNQVKYLVIGGYAVAIHGHPRYTKDLDIWIEMSPVNAQKLMTALTAFGFGSLGLNAEDFQTPDQIIQLGYPPNRIDLITSPDGIDFPTCYKAKIEVKINEINVNFIDLDNLKKNKQASGRLQENC